MIFASTSMIASARTRALTRPAALSSYVRLFASAPSADHDAKTADISANNLKTTIASTKKSIPANKDLVFGQTFADHMLSVEWRSTKGWSAPRIHPYEKICLDPSATVFHYAIECFEGLKAYKDKNGKIRMFRPDMNMARLANSCKRLTLPAFNKEEFLACIKQLLKTDERWIPSERGYSLYIRPTAIATQESLGVGPSSKALLFVITCPVGPYYKTGFSAVSLSATSNYVRAWPGGTGDAKIGANYAPGIRPQIEVAKKGYQQNLWIFGKEDYITEVGTMNLFVLWKTPEGKTELVTPPLDGTILPGVTRDSVIQLAKEWGQSVSERPVSMKEITKAVEEGRMLEMFGSGTAAIVSPIKNILYKGKDWAIPLDPKDKSSQAGPFTKKLADTIMGIQYGEIPHKWSVIVD